MENKIHQVAKQEGIFEQLFNSTNTYEELPLMLERAAYDVSRSEFDGLKEHSIGYHVSGMVDIVEGVKKALKHLQDESIILEIDLASEMDNDQFRKYQLLIGFLKDFG